MRILIDIGHPGHVHFFKHFIWEMEKRGHEILITARNKEITLELLSKYQFDFIPVGEQRQGKFNMMKEWIRRDIKILRIAKKFHPDFIMGIGNPTVAHVSKIIGTTSIVFTDTEHAKFANRFTFPFSSVICTPSCFVANLGPKQIRYNGYHELAYLHPNRFTPNPSILGEQGLSPDDPLIVVRFVSWEASHDIGQHGIMDKIKLVNSLEKFGHVVITSEITLPAELQPYRVRVPPDKIHDLLYYALMYVGEGATMASECAMLGTHAIYVNTLSAGTIAEQSEKYLLISDFSCHSCNDDTVLAEAARLLENINLRKESKLKRERILREKTDVTAFMMWFVENYPRSFSEMKARTPEQDEAIRSPISSVTSDS